VRKQNLITFKIDCAFVHIVGLVETGLFIDMAFRVYFGMADGSTKTIDKVDPTIKKGNGNGNGH